MLAGRVGGTVRRQETTYEIDLRWRQGVLRLTRHLSQAGYWERNHQGVFHGTMDCAAPPPLERTRRIEQMHALYSLLSDFDAVQISWVFRDKAIGSQGYEVSSWYFMVEAFGERFALLVSGAISDPSAAVQAWIGEIKAHFALPIVSGAFEAEILQLSPAVLGCLLHEMLGHSLEEPSTDDLAQRFVADFDVFDQPGEPHMAGWCPIGDDGSLGHPVPLLSGATGKLQPLSAESGNLRAVSWMWHPIVIQRCLAVRPLEGSFKPVPESEPRLIIDDAELGAWDERSRQAILHVVRARLQTTEGKLFRIPRLRLAFRMGILSHLRVAGESQEHSPGGGCHKDLQRGLPVTFVAPSGWIRLSGVQDLIEVNDAGGGRDAQAQSGGATPAEPEVSHSQRL